MNNISGEAARVSQVFKVELEIINLIYPSFLLATNNAVAMACEQVPRTVRTRQGELQGKHCSPFEVEANLTG
jgi:hypothetical protein